MKIEWTPAAARDRRHQVRYLSKRNPQAAIDLGHALERATGHLASHPLMGRPGRILDTRELVVSGTPFVVVYTVGTDRLSIVRVLHGAQQWPPEADALGGTL